MVLAGLQKNSFIDYPGKLSCVCFLSGCNFDCPYCHNPGLVRRGSSTQSVLDEKGFFRFLEEQKGFLDGVVVSGGEPTFSAGLFSLCDKIKNLGYPVKLDTNGSRPKAIEALIRKSLVDYIAMDIKTDPGHYPGFIRKDCDPESILASIRLIMESGLSYEFRTTCVRPIIDAHIIASIAKIIQGAELYALQKFHDVEVLHPEFFQGIAAGYGDEDMVFLKSIAEPWVETCTIR
ncbi:MAG: anaerobic ribonucleoside-triphosphate reductase activating protein [Deltaproteobacteria bacterium]